MSPKGDKVQIKANIPRGSWEIDKIIELWPNGEGKERAAKVLLATKTTVNQPLNLLYSMECECILKDTNAKINQLSNRTLSHKKRIHASEINKTIDSKSHRWHLD